MIKRWMFAVVSVFFLASHGYALDWSEINPELSGATFVMDSEKCLECHEEQMDIYKHTPHSKAFKFNPRGGDEKMECELCHGPMSKHLESPRKSPPLAASFKKGSGMSAQQRSLVCLQCHEKGVRMQWKGNPHDMGDVSCDNCHVVMKVEKSVKEERCYSCHPKTRAEFQRASHIPVREGEVRCFGCHNPHGGKGPSLLKDASINDTCYGCHPEKRGPFLWEHAPVRENCMNCHNPHGSNHENLLRIKPPYLCQQQCHTPRNHPTNAYSGSNVAGNVTIRNAAVGKSCLNCHSQVHGSNHPSGPRFQR